VATLMGYDWTRGRLDKTLHPFTSGFGIDDVRITTRVLPSFLTSALYSTMHEVGHGLYELGFVRFRRSPLESSAFHGSPRVAVTPGETRWGARTPSGSFLPHAGSLPGAGGTSRLGVLSSSEPGAALLSVEADEATTTCTSCCAWAGDAMLEEPGDQGPARGLECPHAGLPGATPPSDLRSAARRPLV
jgi:hypothetical protein